MRGNEEKQIEAFSYLPLEDRIPAKRPIRPFKAMVNEILRDMDAAPDELYADSGRPSIAPEYLLRASILQILYTIRSERSLMEEIEFNILFRWFVGLGLDAPAWEHSTFTKNRDRPLESDIAKRFFAKMVERAKRKVHRRLAAAGPRLVDKLGTGVIFCRLSDGATTHQEGRRGQGHCRHLPRQA